MPRTDRSAGYLAGFKDARAQAAAIVEAPAPAPMTRAELARMIRAINPEPRSGAHRAPRK